MPQEQSRSDCTSSGYEQWASTFITSSRTRVLRVVVPVSDLRDETWRRFRVGVLSALLKRKGLVASPGAVAAAAAEDSIERAWKRISIVAMRTAKHRWSLWGYWWRRS